GQGVVRWRRKSTTNLATAGQSAASRRGDPASNRPATHSRLPIPSPTCLRIPHLPMPAVLDPATVPARASWGARRAPSPGTRSGHRIPPVQNPDPASARGHGPRPHPPPFGPPPPARPAGPAFVTPLTPPSPPPP